MREGESCSLTLGAGAEPVEKQQENEEEMREGESCSITLGAGAEPVE